MKQSSLIYYAILMYIFIILGLYLFKPDFIYNNKKKVFKEFGFDDDKTPFSLPIIAIIIAIVIYMILSQFADADKSIMTGGNMPYMIPMMMHPQYNPNIMYYTPGIKQNAIN